MASHRLEILRGMVAANPNDAFARYGLAMEYRGAGDLEGAVREFRALIAAHPDYAASYLYAGETLERLGRTEEARAIYRQGIEVTTRGGDHHAREKLEAALR
jgi:tetratricopeptide (TPR) repeat protein